MSEPSPILRNSSRLQSKKGVLFSKEPSVRMKLQLNRMERIFEKISFHLKNSPTFVELHLVRSRSMKKLNRQFRGKNKATDVLSFSSQQRNLLGSVVVDVDIAKRQARLYRHSLEREIQELFIHGVLHLLGFDHSTPKEAEVMRRFENYFGVILDKFSKRGKSKIRQHH